MEISQQHLWHRSCGWSNGATFSRYSAKHHLLRLASIGDIEKENRSPSKNNKASPLLHMKYWMDKEIVDCGYTRLLLVDFCFYVFSTSYRIMVEIYCQYIGAGTRTVSFLFNWKYLWKYFQRIELIAFSTFSKSNNFSF